MSNSKHTPGPWQVQQSKPIRGISLGREIVSGIRHIAEVRPIADEDEANARLIASAPELLNTAKELLTECEQLLKDLGPCDHPVGICSCGLRAMIESAQEVIAKAEGIQ